MWDEILDGLEQHETALLTGFDEDGFPFSIRCQPTAERKNRRLLIDIPDSARIQPGKASVLMHSHNEELWDLIQFLIRGTLVKTDEGHYFVPASVSGSPRKAGALDAIKTLRAIRRRGNAYLNNRNLPRPEVPWDDIQRFQQRAAEWRENRNPEQTDK
jgi:hypothetical protein